MRRARGCEDLPGGKLPASRGNIVRIFVDGRLATDNIVRMVIIPQFFDSQELLADYARDAIIPDVTQIASWNPRALLATNAR